MNKKILVDAAVEITDKQMEMVVLLLVGVGLFLLVTVIGFLIFGG